MSAARTAPVAMALASSARPGLSGNAWSAAMPEPTIAATSSAVPIASAVTIPVNRWRAGVTGVVVSRVVTPNSVTVQTVGLVARTMAAWIPSAASWANSTCASVNPTAASPSRYSLLERAPAMHPT